MTIHQHNQWYEARCPQLGPIDRDDALSYRKVRNTRTNHSQSHTVDARVSVRPLLSSGARIHSSIVVKIPLPSFRLSERIVLKNYRQWCRASNFLRRKSCDQGYVCCRLHKHRSNQFPYIHLQALFRHGTGQVSLPVVENVCRIKSVRAQCDFATALELSFTLKCFLTTGKVDTPLTGWFH